MSSKKSLLSIIELGGYPDFTALYKQFGFEPVVVYSMRKALKLLKEIKPKVIVAEFNYQSDFRDRTSSLESLIAVAQRNPDMKLIIFFEKDFQHQFDKLQSTYSFYETYSYPVEKKKIKESLKRIILDSIEI